MRNRWLAVLFSLFMSGLGQAYDGRIRRGAAFFVISLAVTVLTFALAMPLHSVVVLITGLVVSFGFGLFVLIDAWRLAKQAPPPSGRLDRWYTYLAVLVIWTVFGANAFQELVKSHFGSAFRTASSSMEPTIFDGDWLFATPRVARVGPGDIAAYRMGGAMLMHRVVAVEGDTVSMRRDTLVVNGKPASEPYARAAADERPDDAFDWQRARLVGDPSSYHPTMSTWGPLVVPRHELFLLGDNRGESRDSRLVGFIPVDSVRLSPAFVYFSWDGPASGVRWERIGRSLRR
jgi:signal peptidase I